MTTVGIEAVILLVNRLIPNPVLYSRTPYFKQLFINAFYAIGRQPNLPSTWHIGWIGAIWFLIAMFMATQIFYFIMSIPFSGNTIFNQGIVCTFLSILGMIIAPKFTLLFSFNTAFLAQVFLFVGYIIKKYNIIELIRGWIISLFAIVWLICLYLVLFSMDGVFAPNMFISVVGAIVISLLLMRWFYGFEKKAHFVLVKRFLILCGSNSLLILCYHLIELDNIQLWGKLIAWLTQHQFPYGLAILIGIVYRIIIAITLAYVTRYIPLLRNLMMNRTFPIKSWLERQEEKS